MPGGAAAFFLSLWERIKVRAFFSGNSYSREVSS
jgi:hypothetical protein